MKCPHSLGEVNPGQKLKSGNINSVISAQLRVLVLESKWRVPAFGLVPAKKKTYPFFLQYFDLILNSSLRVLTSFQTVVLEYLFG